MTLVGNMLSNAEILDCIQDGLIEITRFERSCLKLAHYRLRPGNAFRIGAPRPDGSRPREFVHDFADGPLTLKAGEVVLVTPLERVRLAEGVVGQVRPASTLVEQCFDLTAGKLDPGYGTIGGRSQDFVVALSNQLDRVNTFHPEFGIANISFVSFRSVGALPAVWTEAEARSYSARDLRFLRAADDGISYPDDVD